MDWIQILALSLLQGLTEFLPISSSAHLILAPVLMDWHDQGLAFDIAVHVGTLLAVVTYFRRQLKDMLIAGAVSVAQRQASPDAWLLLKILLATAPALVIGGLFHHEIETSLRSPLIIAAMTLLFGVLLLLANRERAQPRDEYQISMLLALGIGLAQVLAFVPGTSRSGVTMTAAVLLGMRRDAGARFSFLLSIPVILGSGVFKLAMLLQSPIAVDWGALLAGLVLAAISAFVCIHYFLRFIETIGFTPFVIYRLLLGGLLLVLYL